MDGTKVIYVFPDCREAKQFMSRAAAHATSLGDTVSLQRKSIATEYLVSGRTIYADLETNDVVTLFLKSKEE